MRIELIELFIYSDEALGGKARRVRHSRAGIKGAMTSFEASLIEQLLLCNTRAYIFQ